MPRVTRLSVLVALAVTALACDPTAPNSSVVGEYNLSTINGKALPTAGANGIVYTSGVMSIRASHAFVETVYFKLPSGTPSFWGVAGTWSVNGDKMVQVDTTLVKGNSRTGGFTSNSITFAATDTFVYRR